MHAGNTDAAIGDNGSIRICEHAKLRAQERCFALSNRHPPAGRASLAAELCSDHIMQCAPRGWGGETLKHKLSVCLCFSEASIGTEKQPYTS